MELFNKVLSQTIKLGLSVNLYTIVCVFIEDWWNGRYLWHLGLLLNQKGEGKQSPAGTQRQADSTLHYITLQYSTVQYSTVQCINTHSSLKQQVLNTFQTLHEAERYFCDIYFRHFIDIIIIFSLIWILSSHKKTDIVAS